MTQQNRGFLNGLIQAIAAAILMTGTVAQAADEHMERLSPENRALAQRMLASVARWDHKYRDRAIAMNGAPSAPETLHHETEFSIYDIWVTRGPVIEKLGRMLAEAKKQQPDRKGSPLVWSRFYSLDYHARTPLVGMLHSALLLQFYEDGTGFVGGWLGVMNGTRNEQDMAQLTKVVDDRYAKFGKSPELYRRMMMQGPQDADPRFKRRPDPSGVSLYGPPAFPEDIAKTYELAEGLFEQFDDAYLEIVARRAKQRYTPEDEARRDEMRKRWLTDQLFSDPLTSKVVPYEVWSLSDMPPMIRF